MQPLCWSVEHESSWFTALFYRFALVDFGLAQRATTSTEESASDSSSRLKLQSPLQEGSVPAISNKQVTIRILVWPVIAVKIASYGLLFL